MSRFLILCLILSDAFAVLATEAKTKHKMASFNFADAPSPSPSYNGKSNLAKAPTIRKLGKQKKEEFEPVAAGGQSLVLSQGPTEANSFGQESGMSQIHLEKKHHHHNVDKSIAGGGVILGGLATMFLVAVFCYIRATRRISVESGV